MRCPHCGNDLTQDYAYCPHCGKPTGERPAQPVAAPPAPPLPNAPAPAPQPPEDDADLIDSENEERGQDGLPPVPGGRRKVSHAGPVAAAVIVGALAVFFAVIVIVGVSSAYDYAKQPTWSGGSSGWTGPYELTEDADGNASDGTDKTELLRPRSEEDATGRYYAFWAYEDEVWGYVYDLYADGTGEFHLFLAEGGEDFTREDVDNETYSEGLVWSQDGSDVIVGNPEDEDTLPDGPNGYTMTGTAGGRIIYPQDSDQYPNQPLYEDYDEAIANMM